VTVVNADTLLASSDGFNLSPGDRPLALQAVYIYYSFWFSIFIGFLYVPSFMLSLMIFINLFGHIHPCMALCVDNEIMCLRCMN
jgi:hypothetical protein